MDGRNRTDWDIGIEVVRRMRESAGSREAFLMIPKLYSQTPGYGHIQKSAAAHFEPAHVFTHPNKVAVETAFGPGLKYSWRTVNAREIEVTYSTDATCPGTREFWELQGVIISKTPGFIGLPDAAVELTRSEPHLAVYHCVLPPPAAMGLGRTVRTDNLPSSPPGGPVSSKEKASPELRGNEVSCRVIIGVVEMAQASGLSRENLLAGFRHSPEHLMNPGNRTDWEIGIEVLSRLRREAGSREAFLAIAQNYGRTPVYGFLNWMAGALFSPAQLYGYPQGVVLRMLVGRGNDWKWKAISPREIEGVYTTDHGHPAPLEYWEFSAVTLSKLTNLLGLPDAVVDLRDHSPHHGRYRILVPPADTLWAKATRFFLRHSGSPDPVFSVYEQQHEDLRQSYETLSRTERERAELAGDLLRVADKEREHFAREIHDGLGQELVAIKYQLEHLAHQAEGNIGAQAAKLAELVTSTHELARSLARSYDPLTGTEGNFSAAIGRLAAQYKGKVEFVLSGLEGVSIEPDKATHLYRIAQEAVNNALRHGHASQISLSLRRNDGGMELLIEDNGCGLPPQEPEGMGMRSMRYRAGEIGGKLEVKPGAGGGVCLVCSFPGKDWP